MSTSTSQVPSLTKHRSMLDASDVEPDAKWKAALWKQIEDGLRSLVRDTKDLFNARLRKAPASVEGRERLNVEYTKTITDLQYLAQTEFMLELRRERVKRRLVAGPEEAIKRREQEGLQQEKEKLKERQQEEFRKREAQVKAEVAKRKRRYGGGADSASFSSSSPSWSTPHRNGSMNIYPQTGTATRRPAQPSQVSHQSSCPTKSTPPSQQFPMTERYKHFMEEQERMETERQAREVTRKKQMLPGLCSRRAENEDAEGEEADDIILSDRILMTTSTSSSTPLIGYQTNLCELQGVFVHYDGPADHI